MIKGLVKRALANLGIEAKRIPKNRFGWLRGGALWPSGPDPVRLVIFAQWNYFWKRSI